MKREAEPMRRPSKRHEAANMDDAVAAIERSRNIYFVKTLQPTSIDALNRTNYMVLPAKFVRENADNIEEWVTLRVQSSNGRSLRPWAVRLSVDLKSTLASTVRFAGGWKDFSAGNRLSIGDTLLFLLKEDVRSEFEVHVFRGPQRSPYFPDLIDSSSSSFTSDDGEVEEKKYASNSKDKEGIAEGLSEAFPSFHKQLTISSIRRSIGCDLMYSGQFEIPRRFVEAHGEHLQASVQVQGVYKESPVFVIRCKPFTYANNHTRILFKMIDWNEFARANRLEVGQELQFSLIADSYFKDGGELSVGMFESIGRQGSFLHECTPHPYHAADLNIESFSSFTGTVQRYSVAIPEGTLLVHNSGSPVH